MPWGEYAFPESSSEEDESDANDSPEPPFIDPDWLEAKCEDCVCSVCLGVMVKPASGCREGHSFCQSCLTKALRTQRRCPTCRQHISWTNALVPNRTAENMINNFRCRHVTGEEENETVGPSAAKRAKLAPAASTTAAGCGWKGTVGGLGAHLGECQWTRAARSHRFGRMHLSTMRYAASARSNAATASEGCFERMPPLFMNTHRARCEHQRFACPCPGCDARLLRKHFDAHFEERHMGSS